MTEEEIVLGCKRGDNIARRELYELYGAYLLSVCRRYSPDTATAEDNLSESILKIFGAIGRFEWRGEGSLREWCRRIAVNEAIDRLRRTARHRPVPLEQIEAAAEPSAEETAQVPAELLRRWVEELPQGYRTVFNLYCDGYSHREIGRMLGINENSSSSQFYRARQLLARKIKDYTSKNGKA